MKKAIDIFIGTLNFLGSAFLTIFAGVFALMALIVLVTSIAEPSFAGFIGLVGFAFAACICWECRRVLR